MLGAPVGLKIGQAVGSTGCRGVCTGLFICSWASLAAAPGVSSTRREGMGDKDPEREQQWAHSDDTGWQLPQDHTRQSTAHSSEARQETQGVTELQTEFVATKLKTGMCWVFTMQFTAQVSPGPTVLLPSTLPEVSQAQLQLLAGFVSGDVVGGRASFILGRKKNQFSISNDCSEWHPSLGNASCQKHLPLWISGQEPSGTGNAVGKEACVNNLSRTSLQ